MNWKIASMTILSLLVSTVAVGEEADTIEEVYEPYLIQKGYINRTPKGRTATERCYKHFGLQPGGAQPDLGL